MLSTKNVIVLAVDELNVNVRYLNEPF